MWPAAAMRFGNLGVDIVSYGKRRAGAGADRVANLPGKVGESCTDGPLSRARQTGKGSKSGAGRSRGNRGGLRSTAN